MAKDTEELMLVIGISARIGTGEKVFYIEVFDAANKGSGVYLKKDGQIKIWSGSADYIKSYEDCIKLITTYYDIIEEVGAPDGFTGVVALNPAHNSDM